MSSPLDKLNKLKGESGKKDLTETDKSKNKPSAEVGVKEGYTRFSFIANKEQLEIARVLAWYRRKNIKDVIEAGLNIYYEGIEKEIKKAFAEYEKANK